MKEKWESNTINLKGVSYLSADEYCENGHYNIIPACTVIEEGVNLHCLTCGTLIFRVTKVRKLETEI